MNDTATKDLEHLRLLGVFHYVVAGISGLFALFPLINHSCAPNCHVTCVLPPSQPCKQTF